MTVRSRTGAIVAAASLVAGTGLMPVVDQPRLVGLLGADVVLGALLGATPRRTRAGSCIAVALSLVGWIAVAVLVVHELPSTADLGHVADAFRCGPVGLVSQPGGSGHGSCAAAHGCAALTGPERAVVPSGLVWLSAATGVSLAHRRGASIAPLVPALSVAAGANALAFSRSAWHLGVAAALIALTALYLRTIRDAGHAPGRTGTTVGPDTAWRRSLADLALIVVLCGAGVGAGMAVALFAGHAADPYGAAAGGRAGADPSDRHSDPVPAGGGAGSDATASPGTRGSNPARHVPPATHAVQSTALALVVLAVLVGVVLVVFLLARRARRRWARARLRRRGTPAARVLAAWRDTVAELRRTGLGVEPELTINELVERVLAQDDRDLSRPLRCLAGAAATVVYDPTATVSGDQAQAAWRERDTCVAAMRPVKAGRRSGRRHGGCHVW
jgi:hypothetical protein